MTRQEEHHWTSLEPALPKGAALELLVALARKLSRASKHVDSAKAEGTREAFVLETRTVNAQSRVKIIAAGMVLFDLAAQGWELRVRSGGIQIRPQRHVSEDPSAEKARIKRQELVKRDAQLRQDAVARFVKSMERSRLYQGKFVSIFSLMRDGRELASVLRDARAHLSNGWAEVLAGVIDPYLVFVSEDAVCEHTGLRLMDVWRYFRHTWTNQYTSVPGRSMMFIVRDRAAACHPVVGIGALCSPIMQIRQRDMWIGWHPDAVVQLLRDAPTVELARWLVQTVDTAIAETYVEDFIEDDTVTRRMLRAPDDATIEKLLDEAAAQRKQHHRFTRSRDLKETTRAHGHWVRRARTHLFRSKRALALVAYLQARRLFALHFKGGVTVEGLRALVSTSAGADVVRKIVKKAKGDRIGISVADISVCGAIQPYNAILGGKLVAMLATSPEVIQRYRARYQGAESEIASSMAGYGITREPSLVLLGTTSLYGVGSSQYNRVKIPASVFGAAAGAIEYDALGKSASFGTSQYSDETVTALCALAAQSTNGQRVNSIFGEGTSPKLRKVRQGLDLLGFPSSIFLRHYRQRVVYVVSLVSNLREYLLGLAPTPQYIVPLDGHGAGATGRIAAWWRERWLRRRILSDEVLAELERHTLVRPIQHGARVQGNANIEDERDVSPAEVE